MPGTVCFPLVSACCPSLSRFHRRCCVPTASNAFRPPTILGSLAHMLLCGHWPLQENRTDVTVRTFVLHLHIGCPLPPSSLLKIWAGKRRLERNSTHSAVRWGFLVVVSPSSMSSITTFSPCGCTGAQHALCSLLESVSIHHSSTQFLKWATKGEN